MSVPVLDTMISHVRTARNCTLQSEKLSMNGVFDHLEPEFPSLCRLRPHEGPVWTAKGARVALDASQTRGT